MFFCHGGIAVIYTMTLNPALDYVMQPNTLDMGCTNRSQAEELQCGGKGINVSALLNELEMVIFIHVLCSNLPEGVFSSSWMHPDSF